MRIFHITIDYPELLNMDDSEDNKLWPWYGDLISDPNNNDKDALMLDIKQIFIKNLEKQIKINIYQLAVVKKQMRVVYDCENNNP